MSIAKNKIIINNNATLLLINFETSISSSVLYVNMPDVFYCVILVPPPDGLFEFAFRYQIQQVIFTGTRLINSHRTTRFHTTCGLLHIVIVKLDFPFSNFCVCATVIECCHIWLCIAPAPSSRRSAFSTGYGYLIVCCPVWLPSGSQSCNCGLRPDTE